MFETHSISEDNELGLASGWTHGPLSEQGRELTARVGRPPAGRRHRHRVRLGPAPRARTAILAFEGETIPILLDWRLRECDYGQYTRQPAVEMHRDREQFLETPYPGGESWRRRSTASVGSSPTSRHAGTTPACLIIGHVATRWGLDHFLNGVPLEDLAKDFAWQEGWEYVPSGVLERTFSDGGSDGAEAAFAALELGDRVEEVPRRKSGQSTSVKHELRVRELPEEVVRDPELARRAHEQIGIGHVGRVEMPAQRALVDLLRVEPTLLHLRGDRPRRRRRSRPGRRS